MNLKSYRSLPTLNARLSDGLSGFAIVVALITGLASPAAALSLSGGINIGISATSICASF